MCLLTETPSCSPDEQAEAVSDRLDYLDRLALWAHVAWTVCR